jgi:hypothetical protein
MSGPLKLGAEPKKVMFLGGLLLVAAGIYFFGPSGGDAPKGLNKGAAPPSPSAKKLIQASQAPAEVEPATTTGGPAAAGKAAARDFKPSMKHRPGETADPEKADPTLRTDLLAKLSAVRLERVERSLFDFSTAAATPTVKLPEPKIVVLKPVKRMIGPQPPPPPPAPQVKPPPPPIPLKFYGRALPLRGGTKRVFCLLNDEVNIPAEGDVIQRRYKIHRITATTVVVEDLSFNNQQTLPIEEPTAQGGF